MTLTLNRLAFLAALVIFLIVAIMDILGNPVPHETAWISVGLAAFVLGFLVP